MAVFTKGDFNIKAWLSTLLLTGFRLWSAMHDSMAIYRGRWLRAYSTIRYRGRVSIGENFRVYGGGSFIHSSKGGSIIIGSGVTLRNNTRSNYVGVDKPCSIVAVGAGRIRIGDNVGISGCSICAYDAIDIAEMSTIGANVRIIDTDFHAIDGSIRREDVKLGRDSTVHAKTGAVQLGTNCFVAMNCTILRGVAIGADSVIGAGSIVTRSVPERQLWAGSPARFCANLGNISQIHES